MSDKAKMQCLKQLFGNILSTKAYIQAARNVDRWMLVYCYCHAENKNTSTPDGHGSNPRLDGMENTPG